MVSPLPDEAVLVDQAVAGDAEAFGRLYMQLRDAIYRYIYARVSDPSEAEDLTSQVFLKAWEAMPRYERRDVRFASWVYRIAHNTTIDYLRDRRKGAFPLDLVEPVEVPGTTVEQVIAAEEREHLSQAIDQLPEVQRKVIKARYYENLSYPEIAELVAKSLGACRVIQHRALANLNQFLKSTLSVVMLLGLLIVGTVYASGEALPGDLNYPIKRIGEATRLATALDPASEANLHLVFSRDRLDELDGLLEARRTAELEATLRDYLAQLDSLEQALAADGPLSSELRRSLAERVLVALAADEQRLAAVAAEAARETQPLIEAARDRAAVLYQLAREVEPAGAASDGAIGGAATPPAPTAQPQPAAQHVAQGPAAALTVQPAAPTSIPTVPVSTAQPLVVVPPAATAAPPPATPSPLPSPTPPLVGTAAPATGLPPAVAPPATAIPPPSPAPPSAIPAAPPASGAAPQAPPDPTATALPTPEPLPTSEPEPPPAAPDPGPQPGAPPPAAPAETPLPTATATVQSGLPFNPPITGLPGTVSAELLPPLLTVPAGTPVEARIVIVNLSQSALQATVRVPLPGPIEPVAGSTGDGGRYDPAARAFIWESVSVPPGSFATVAFSVTGAQPGEVTIRGEITIDGAPLQSDRLTLRLIVLPAIPFPRP